MSSSYRRSAFDRAMERIEKARAAQAANAKKAKPARASRSLGAKKQLGTDPYLLPPGHPLARKF